MLPNILSLTKNAYGTCAFDVSMPNYDVWETLGRSLSYALINLAYDSERILFITKIKNDLQSRIHDLKNWTEEDYTDYTQYEFNNEYVNENRIDILNLCSFLIKDVPYMPENVREFTDVLMRDADQFQKCLMKFLIECNSEEDKQYEFEMSDVRIPMLEQSGFSINMFSCALNYASSVTFKYTPGIECNIFGLVSCFNITMGDTDKYLAVIGGLHPIPAYIEKGIDCTNLSVTRKLFTNSEQCIKVLDTYKLTKALTVLVKLRSKVKTPIGKLTTILLDYLKDQGINIAYYLKDVYTGNTDMGTNTVEVYKSSEAYDISHDVSSDMFVSLEAGEADESDEIDDLQNEAPEEDPEKPEDEEPKDDIKEEPEEPSPSSVAKGIIIELATNVTLDSYIYREEVRLEITRILNDNTIELSQYARTALKRLVSYWLHFLTPKSIDSMIKSVANISIKYK